MLKKIKLIIISFTCFVFLLVDFSLADTSSLPDSINIADELGNSIDGLGNYFIENNDIKPGDTFSRTLTISDYPVNSEDQDISYNISLLMKPIEQDGKADLFNNVSLKLTSNDKVIFDGNIIGIDSSGNNYQQTPLFVTHISPGEAKKLVAEFHASEDLPTDYWVEEFSWADFAWQFLAVDEVAPIPSSSSGEVSSSDSTSISESAVVSSSSSSAALRLPQTGEEWAVTLLGLAVGIIVITFVLVIVKKMRDNKEE